MKPKKLRQFSLRRHRLFALVFPAGLMFLLLGVFWSVGANCRAADLPTVFTEVPGASVDDVHPMLAGSLVNQGGSAITDKGFDFGTSVSYGQHSALGDNPFFAETISGGITCGDTYHYRAWATNDSGTGYGDDRAFVACAPTLSTGLPVVLDQTSATLKGTINKTGNEITEEGFRCGPTPGSNGSIWPVTVTDSNFSFTASGLSCGTTFYCRSYATNQYGTGYGNDQSFTTNACPSNTPATPTSTSSSLDAIGIRIVANPEHYSIERWYKAQNFSGSPQFLTVDGYEAIRDGRTVYVNATNVDDVNKKIYTNVYLISYNQESQAGTTDALGKIIANWKFNNNLQGEGQCGLTVAPTSSCLIDSDCLGVGFCTSLKARITRDIKRLSILAEIKDALNTYQTTNGRFPDLPSGSYVPHLTMSTWPSWKNTFSPQLGIDASMVDPINQLGSCPGFATSTCWNKNQNKFAAATDPLSFPNNSLVLAYQSKNSGALYSLCASMETGNGYDTVDGLLSGEACNVKNTALSSVFDPVLEATNLQGEFGQPFNGYIKIVNPGGNPLTWSLTFPAPINTPAATFQSPPILVDTNNPQQKKIYSPKALSLGTLPIVVKIDDNHGGHLEIDDNIVIGKSKPSIEAENSEFLLNNNKLDYAFYLNDDSVADTGSPNFDLLFNGHHYSIAVGAVIPMSNNLNLRLSRVVRGRFEAEIFQNPAVTTGSLANISGVSTSSPQTILSASVTLTNSSYIKSSKDFSLTLKQDKPVFDYQCDDSVRLHGQYQCTVKLLNAQNHKITYAVSGLPAGLSASTTDNVLQIAGVANGSGTSNGANYQPTPSGFVDAGLSTWNQDQAHDSVVRGNLLGVYQALPPMDFIIPNGSAVIFSPRSSSASSSINASSRRSSFLIRPLILSFWSSSLTPISRALSFAAGVFRAESALAAQTPSNVYPITITATNEYGAAATTVINLSVNTYCGDGIKQTPNQEQRGGAYNDGLEECDGASGIATSTKDSSVTKQYSCTTAPNANIPNPISSNNYCRMTGGYCGDGICGSKDGAYSTDDFETYDPEMDNPNADQYCHADCGYCGDGIIQTSEGEQCDPGDPYSVQAGLGEACTNRCQIVRVLNILQVYPDNNTSTTISVGSTLDALANNYTSFRHSVAISETASSTTDSATGTQYAVDTVNMSTFNASTTSFLPIAGNILGNYNMIVFGLGKNDSQDLTTSSALIVNEFVKNGGMVVFGHGTADKKTTGHDNFNGLIGNFWSLSSASFDTVYFTSIVKNASLDLGSRAPFVFPAASLLVNSSEPLVHASLASNCGPQCGGSSCTASSSLPYSLFDNALDSQYSWAGVCNRVSLTQLGYFDNNGQPNLNPTELKIFGNIIYHLSTLVSGDNF